MKHQRHPKLPRQRQRMKQEMQKQKQEQKQKINHPIPIRQKLQMLQLPKTYRLDFLSSHVTFHLNLMKVLRLLIKMKISEQQSTTSVMLLRVLCRLQVILDCAHYLLESLRTRHLLQSRTLSQLTLSPITASIN